MHRSLFLLLLISASTLLSAGAAEPPFKQRDGRLVDGRGMVVYTFDKDVARGVSTCYAQCAALWPPALGTGSVAPQGDFSLAPRKDGRLQWAWRGKPLYYWLADKKPGDATGEVVAGWHLVR